MNFVVSEIDVRLTPVSYKSGAEVIVKYVRPEWDMSKLKVKEFSDGITNKLLGLYTGEEFEKSEVLLVRIYGENTGMLIDREAELRNLLVLNEHKMTGRVFARFSNGLVYEFRHGQVADEEMIWRPSCMRLIAKELARLHSLQLDKHKHLFSNWKQATFFTKLKKWADQMPDVFTEPEKQAKYAHFPSKEKIQKEIKSVESCLSLGNCRIVFSHNDTLIKNFVYSKTEDRVYLIDFEYADFNYEPFDIGNHFVEFAGVENPDWTRYPGREFQLRWLRHYIHYRDFFTANANVNLPAPEIDDGSDPEVNEAELQQLYTDVQKFAVVSHLFWSVWAILQGKFSCIDFDYIGYGLQRWREYESKRNVIQMDGNQPN